MHYWYLSLSTGRYKNVYSLIEENFKKIISVKYNLICIYLWLFSLIGNVVNGTIGKQMVDTLVESASNVEVRIISPVWDIHV